MSLCNLMVLVVVVVSFSSALEEGVGAEERFLFVGEEKNWLVGKHAVLGEELMLVTDRSIPPKCRGTDNATEDKGRGGRGRRRRVCRIAGWNELVLRRSRCIMVDLTFLYFFNISFAESEWMVKQAHNLEYFWVHAQGYNWK